ncbi:FG-GAP-like repeat-containing protein [Streptomyces sp. NPDC012888]|uniref:FG-GAP-like repeat-containing protein n=1 Tax=Streptomyces sp. NPDC012888 TaxID=3364855 RepID=UPI0036B45E74
MSQTRPARPSAGRRLFRGGVSVALAGVLGVAGPAVLPERASAAAAGTAVTDPVASGAVSEEDHALARAKATGQPYELLSARSEASDTWALPDGTWQVKRHGTPVRMFRAGAWVATDPTLVFGADGSVVPKATTVAVTFSGGGDGPLLTGVMDGRTLSLTWPGTLPKPALAANVATYAEVLPGVDLQLKADVEGFSQLLVVKNAEAARNPALASLKYKLDTVGLSVATDAETGSVTAVNPAGETVFTSPSPLMWDSTTITSEGATAPAAPARFAAFGTTTADGGSATAVPADAFEPAPGSLDAQMPTTVTGDTLEIKPDQALLNGAGTRYPVYIDPSWAWGKRQNWTRVYKKYPNTSFWNTKEVVRVGYENETSGLSRSFFQLDTANVKGAQVKSSVFRIRNTWSWSCQDRPVQLWHVGPISPRTTWNRQPGRIGSAPLATVDDAKGWSTDCAAGNLEFDATAKVREAAAKGWASLNLGLYAADETDTFGWKKFDAKSAVLETVYNHPPMAPVDLGTSPRTSCATGGALGNTRVSLYARFDDRDGGNLTAEFQLFKAGTATPHKAAAVPAVKGRISTWAVPDADLPSGDWTWKARAKDQDGVHSAWSATCKFSIDRTRPVKPPLITSADNAYPPGNNGWPAVTGTGGVDAGMFAFAPNGVTDVRKYYYSTSWDPTVRDEPVTADDPATTTVDESVAKVPLTPPGAGPHFVYAYSVDAAGNRSDTAVYLLYADRRPLRDGPKDLNGDGSADLWSLDTNGALLTYAGTGNGQFSAAVTGGKSFAGAQVVFGGGWTGTGYTDLVSMEHDPVEGRKRLWVYRNNGRGMIDGQNRTELTVTCRKIDVDAGCPEAADDHWFDADQVIAPGDLNNDGQPDLLVKQHTFLWAYYGNRGSFDLDLANTTPPVLVGGGDWDRFTVIAPGDTNGDGVPDLWLRDRATGEILRAHGKNGPRGYLDPTTWGAPEQRVRIGQGLKEADFPVVSSSGDVTGDEIADLWARRSDNALLGWPGQAPGADGVAFGTPFGISRTLPAGVAGGTPGKPDMSGDTFADMVVHEPNGTLSIRRKDPVTRFFDTGTAVSWGWESHLGQEGQGRLYFADVNGDGTKDLLSHGTDGRIIVRRNDRVGTGFDTGTLMSANWSNFLGHPGQGRLYFADVTGDGKADMMVHGTNGEIHVRRNTGTYFDGGTLMTAGWGNFLGHAGQGRLYFADVTGDGKADMMVHGTNGEIHVRRNMGTYFDGGTLMTAGWGNFLGHAGQGRLYFADVTGDGKADLVVHTAGGEVSYRKNTGTYFDGGTPASAGWSNFLGAPGKGRLYFE